MRAVAAAAAAPFAAAALVTARTVLLLQLYYVKLAAREEEEGAEVEGAVQWASQHCYLWPADLAAVALVQEQLVKAGCTGHPVVYETADSARIKADKAVQQEVLQTAAALLHAE